MLTAGTLLGDHVYKMISINIVFPQIFSCLAVMITPPGKQDGYAPPGILKPGRVSGLLNDMQLVRCKLWTRIVSYAMRMAHSFFHSLSIYLFSS